MYDSVSGYGFIIGCHRGIFIGIGASKKKCYICNVQHFKGVLPVAYECNINLKGPSGEMESKWYWYLWIDNNNSKVCAIGLRSGYVQEGDVRKKN